MRNFCFHVQLNFKSYKVVSGPVSAKPGEGVISTLTTTHDFIFLEAL